MKFRSNIFAMLVVGLLGCGASTATENAGKAGVTETTKTSLTSQESQGIDLTDIKCPVTGEQAKTEHELLYNYARLFMSSEDAVKKIDEAVNDRKNRKTSELVTKANHQLVLTKQFEQKRCPLGEKDAALLDSESLEVMGVKIMFSTKAHKTKFAAKPAAEQFQEVFGYSGFRKFFKKVDSPYFQESLKCFMMPKKDVKPKYTIYHNGSPVFLCCTTCVKNYIKEPAKYAAECNHQIALTGQVEQKKCPVTGGDANDSFSLDIAGVTVKFADEASKTKVESAGDAKAQIEMVFTDENFAKAFTTKG